LSEVALSGLSGFVAGGIGGYFGGAGFSPHGYFKEGAMRATNYITATLNGGLDRMTNGIYKKESAGQVLAKYPSTTPPCSA
jgi:hypothetical protein